MCEGQRITSGVVRQVPSPFCLRQGLSVARSFIKEVMLAGHGLPLVPTFHLAIVGLLTTNHFVSFLFVWGLKSGPRTSEGGALLMSHLSSPLDGWTWSLFFSPTHPHLPLSFCFVWLGVLPAAHLSHLLSLEPWPGSRTLQCLSGQWPARSTKVVPPGAHSCLLCSRLTAPLLTPALCSIHIWNSP